MHIERLTKPQMKRCSHCKAVKAVNGFTMIRVKGRPDRPHPWCKECRAEYNLAAWHRKQRSAARIRALIAPVQP